MTEGAVIPVDIFPCAARWVRGKIIVTIFTAVAASRIDPDIEAWIDSGRTTMTGLAVGQVALGRRPVVGPGQIAAIHWMRGTTDAGAEIPEDDRQGRIGQLMGRIVAMTSGIVATEICLVIFCPGAAGAVHADPAVPVITWRIAIWFEQGVFRSW